MDKSCHNSPQPRPISEKQEPQGIRLYHPTPQTYEYKNISPPKKPLKIIIPWTYFRGFILYIDWEK